MKDIFKGMQYIVDAAGYLIGVPMKRKKRQPVELPTYSGLSADRAALARDKRRAFNRKFKEDLFF